MTLRAGVSIAGVLLAGAWPAAAQELDWSAIEIEAERVAGNVYMLSDVGGRAGGNIGVSVGDDGILLVDDKFEPLVPRIEAALASISDKPVRFVLNTHFHGDHTHGNKIFGLKSTVIAHDNVRRRLESSDDFDGRPGTRPPRHALPLITFDSRMSIHLNGEEIRGIHFPAGHTDGDTVVFFTGSKVVHMGDDFFNGLFPFIDLQGGGTVQGYASAVEQVLADLAPDVRIIPGHGPLATRDDLAAYFDMLSQTTAVIQKGIADGKSVEQLKANKVLAKWESWSWEFITTDRYIEQLHSGLEAAGVEVGSADGASEAAR